MKLRDLIAVSTGNLWRMKLRAILTTSGVIIAIAAFVSMLSFGAGNQEYVTKQFNDLGLLTLMQVYPQKASPESDTAAPVPLDDRAIERLSQIPGVSLAYPYDAFGVTAHIGDSTVTSKAQALSMSAIQTKLFSRLVAGAPFASDSAREIIVSDQFLKSVGITSPDSAVGRNVVLTVKVSSLDSGLMHILVDRKETLRSRFERIRFDSLIYPDYAGRVVRNEVDGAVRRFVEGFLNARAEITDTFRIAGVLERGEMGRARIEPIIVPIATARRFSAGGFTGEPQDLFSALSSGTLFGSGDGSGKAYTQVTLDLEPRAMHKAVGDSVKAIGFRSFSFAEQFDEMRRFFLYFDLALAMVGLIALVTASLGIVNTMLMSMIERRREIGVLKSLGADERDIGRLFLVEAGVIGTFGSVAGIVFGWLITRVASAVAQWFMVKEGIPPAELFALPLWLIAIALAVGLSVSLLAGFYPASRAARVDPVEALRTE
jgi:putative ABC transport system permease protein